MRCGLIHNPDPRLPRIGTALSRLVTPPACDWHTGHVDVDGDPLGNDDHSNCVPCGALRRLQAARSVAGDQRKPTTIQALYLYRDWSGWDGTAATDIGTDSGLAATLWARNGIQWGWQWEDVPIIGVLDPTNSAHLKAAIAFLGPIQLDLALPTAWEGKTLWDVVSDADGGLPGSLGNHRVCAGRYDADHLYVVTWGIEVRITWRALPVYALNAEATVSRSWLDTSGLSPAGLDMAALVREMCVLSV